MAVAAVLVLAVAGGGGAWLLRGGSTSPTGGPEGNFVAGGEAENAPEENASDGGDPGQPEQSAYPSGVSASGVDPCKLVLQADLVTAFGALGFDPLKASRTQGGDRTCATRVGGSQGQSVHLAVSKIPRTSDATWVQSVASKLGYSEYAASVPGPWDRSLGACLDVCLLYAQKGNITLAVLMGQPSDTWGMDGAATLMATAMNKLPAS